MKADAATEAAVKSALDNLAEVYAARNMDALLAVFAPDADIVLLGTGANEKRVGPDNVRRQAESDWSQSEAARFSYQSHLISAAGSVAWTITDSTFTFTIGGQEMSMPMRITFVLEQRGEQWLIMHAHFSVPVSDHG